MNDRDNYRKKMISFLSDIIESESAKSDGEANLDLIENCGDLLNELMENDTAVSDKEIAEKIRMITSRKHRRKTAAPKKGIRRAAAVLCASVLLCVGVGAAYMVEPRLRDGFNAVFSKGIGEQVDSGNLTFGFLGTSRKYNTAEELLESTGLDIMYPHDFPTDMGLKEINTIEETIFPITFTFDDPSFSITVYERGTTRNEEMVNTHDLVAEIDGKTFYISECPDQWIAIVMDELYTYQICASNENDLYILMKGMKYKNE